jgi:hypothetical protein
MYSSSFAEAQSIGKSNKIEESRNNASLSPKVNQENKKRMMSKKLVKKPS